MLVVVLAIGILMDDAIVISESIEHEYRNGEPPLQATVIGLRTQKTTQPQSISHESTLQDLGRISFLSFRKLAAAWASSNQ